MAHLKIRVNEKGGNTTVSKFAKAKDNEKIIFVNDHSTLDLKIGLDQPNALCEKKKDPPVLLPITLQPGGRGEFVICDAYLGSEFKYTATLGQLTSEDPIIIVDNFAIIDKTNPIIIVGAVLLITGLVVGFLAGRYLRRRMGP